MNKILIPLIVFGILIDLILKCDCHFDRNSHYHLSLKESQINVRESIRHFSEDKEHLKEDLNDYYGFKVNPDDLSEKERSYFYFVLHDFDKNKKLDGLELLLSMIHAFDDPTDEVYAHKNDKPAFNPEDPQSYHEQQTKQIELNRQFEQDSKFVDMFLEQYDKDKDGYLSFSEFMIARDEEGH